MENNVETIIIKKQLSLIYLSKSKFKNLKLLIYYEQKNYLNVQ